MQSSDPLPVWRLERRVEDEDRALVEELVLGAPEKAVYDALGISARSARLPWRC